jgi:hypothetical protein
MAKGTQGTAADDFIFERWAQARDLSEAFHHTQKVMLRRLKRAGGELEAPLKALGYEIDVEQSWAEFKAYRPEWCVKDDEPLVVVAVGGVFPVGYFRVDEPAAYLALFLEGFEDNQPEQYRRFADLLYQELGGRPAEWQDRTAEDDWTSPLWAAVPDTDDGARVALARDQKQLKKFTLDQFQRFFGIGDAISRAVQEFASK